MKQRLRFAVLTGIVLYVALPGAPAGSEDRPVLQVFQKNAMPAATLEAAPSSEVNRMAISDANIVWSTYLGGCAFDSAKGIALDLAGNVYVVGETSSLDFPAPGGFDTTMDGGRDVFLAKFSHDGLLLWSTFLGGESYDTGYGGVAVGPEGDVYVCGYAASSDFPSSGTGSSDIARGRHAFVAKFTPDGRLRWSNIIGGQQHDEGWDVAVDSEDFVYLTGETEAVPGEFHAFLARFSGDGAPMWLKMQGGTHLDVGWSVAADNRGAVYIVGKTASRDFPAFDGYSTTFNGGDWDGYITKFDTGDGHVIWSTFHGGSLGEYCTAVDVDSAGNVFVSGATASVDFPTSGAGNRFHSGGFTDVFASSLSSEGQLLWSSYLGSSGWEESFGLALDGRGGVYVTGWTTSDLATGVSDAFITKLDAGDGLKLGEWLLGGTRSDGCSDIAIDPKGGIWLASWTQSTDLPAWGSYSDRYVGGVWDGWVMRLAGTGPTTAVIAASPRTLHFIVDEGAPPAPQTLSIWNPSDLPVRFDMTVTPPGRLFVSPGTGILDNTKVDCSVRPNAATLAPGEYTASIVISGDAVNSPFEIPVSLTVIEGPANLTLSDADFSPPAPTQVEPGDSLALGALVENASVRDAGPFWVEVWGSRTGGLTLDRILVPSYRFPEGLKASEAFSLIAEGSLNSVPDGSYTVVYAVDRPGEVTEADERDNRAVVAGSRLVVVRPRTQVDLVVEDFSATFLPAGTAKGDLVHLSGQVRNQGSSPSGPFWIEFWGSWDIIYPVPNFLFCDSIHVPNLNPAESILLADHPRTLTVDLPGVFALGCLADSEDTINETDETNNYQHLSNADIIGPVQGATGEGADISIVQADFSPAAPLQSAPGDTIHLDVVLHNSGTVDTGRFWVEFWASRDGGLTLCDFIAESDQVANLKPGDPPVGLSFDKPLSRTGDGLYTVVVVVDRPNHVDESDEANNRFAIPQERLLLIRPESGANLVVDEFLVGPEGVIGTIRNEGDEISGPFWIEFWVTPGDPDYPGLDRYAAESIYHPGLAPAESWALPPHHQVYDSVYVPGNTFICFVDRPDQILETDESDNYAIYRAAGRSKAARPAELGQ